MKFLLPCLCHLPKILLLFLLVSICICADAQDLLNRRIDIDLKNTRIADVLTEIGKKGDFFFSYNGNLVPKDSLVTLNSVNQSVSAILKKLFNDRFDYDESKKYLIIKRALLHMAMINTDVANDGNQYSVSGIVVDEHTGERLENASVYERMRAIAMLTDEHGYFRLKFRADSAVVISITAAKSFYRDTSITFLQNVFVKSRPDRFEHNSANKTNRVEKTGLGRLFISTRQKIQSLNIPDFFAKKPFQFSLMPGLSSHGMFTSQVINKFSLNVAGGYTAGVNGVEIGGLFNINKVDARYVQFAGVFNLVGGNVKGLQLAGVNNRVLDTVKGVQLAGFINKTEGLMNGVQLSVLNNQAHTLKGLQIGLINTVDTSHGASFGLFNVVHNGFYKVSLYSSDVANTNLSLKTGTHDFYTSVILSANQSQKEKLYAMGLGIGHDFMFSDRLYLSAEVNYLFANTGLWDDRWKQAKLLLNVQLSKNISLFAGPTYNSYNHSGEFHLPGYKNITAIPDYPEFSPLGHQVKNWAGWEAGLAFNGIFRKKTPRPDTSSSWRLGGAATAGIGWDQPLGTVYGTEIFTSRSLGGNIAAILSLGYTDYTVINSQRQAFAGGDLSTGVYEELYQNDSRSIPLKVSIRAYLSQHFFIEGGIGKAFALNNVYTVFDYDRSGLIQKSYLKLNSSLYSVATGYAFSNGLEAGIKFESYTRYSELKQFAVRLGYSFKLGK